MATAPPEDPARPRWLLAAAVLVAIVLFYVLGLQHSFSWEAIRANLDQWQTAARDNLPLALAIYFLVYVAVAGLSLPAASTLTVIGGALFGLGVGTAAASLGSTLGAVFAFLSSRYVFRPWAEQRFGPRLEKLWQGIDRDGAYYLLTLRLVPLFPFFLVNLGMGLTRMRVLTYALVSMAGMLPGTFLYVNAGRALGTVESPRDLVSAELLISLALLGLAPLAIRKAVQWWLRDRTA